MKLEFGLCVEISVIPVMLGRQTGKSTRNAMMVELWRQMYGSGRAEGNKTKDDRTIFIDKKHRQFLRLL